MAKQTLQLLGSIQVTWVEGHPPRYRSPRAQALLGYLVVERRPISRNKLAALFWPDKSVTGGRSALRRELHNLAALLPDCWNINNQSAHFTPDDQTQIDLYQFQHLEKQERWSEASNFVRGELLEGLYLEDNLEFESWLLGERERWQQRAERVLLQAAEIEQKKNNYPRARRHLARLIQLVPWHEDAYRRMMRLLARNGQFSAALKQYENCRTILAEELTVSPSIATTNLNQRIKEAMLLPPHNLPPQPTPFIGREEELAILQSRLADPDCRLLTLTGVGGIGKSRLALQVAQQVSASDFRLFLHGVAFVPLVGVDGPDLLSAVGSGLGIVFSGQQPPEKQLLTYLRQMEILLLLDNYEHLLPETDLLARILQEAPAVKLLITSRERLNLHEEWLFEVEGLPYPVQELDDRLSDEEPEYAAVSLFTTCAKRINRTLSPATSGTDVASICRLVQGMPLALELSATRLLELSPAHVLAELERGLDILSADTRNISRRHSSLRATFDISWTDLTEEEQTAFSQLSLFRGGFTREAALFVVGAMEPVLHSLSNKSLIRLTSSGRYQIHELLRQYAAEKLATYSELKLVAKERYAAYYGTFLQERELRLLETHQEETLAELVEEIDNIRPAWRWLSQKARIETLDGALWTLAFFYFFRGQVVEGLTLMETTMERVPSPDEGDERIRRFRARLSLFLSTFRYFSGKLVDVHATLPSTLDQLHQVGSTKDVAWALFILHQTLVELGESGRPLYLEEAYAIAQASGPLWLEGFLATRLVEHMVEQSFGHPEQLLDQAMVIGRRLTNPGILANVYLAESRFAKHQGDLRRAKEALEQGLASAKRINDPWMSGLTLAELGFINYLNEQFAEARQIIFESDFFFRRMGAWHQETTNQYCQGEIARACGEMDLAIEYYQGCINWFKEQGISQNTYWVACNLGHALLNQGRLNNSLDYFRDSLRGLEDNSDEYLVGMSLAGIAGLLARREQPKLAAHLAGAAARRFASMHLPLWPADRQDWERIVAEIKEQLDEKIFHAAWETGQEMSREQAVAYALEMVS